MVPTFQYSIEWSDCVTILLSNWKSVLWSIQSQWTYRDERTCSRCHSKRKEHNLKMNCLQYLRENLTEHRLALVKQHRYRIRINSSSRWSTLHYSKAVSKIKDRKLVGKTWIHYENDSIVWILVHPLQEYYVISPGNIFQGPDTAALITHRLVWSPFILMFLMIHIDEKLFLAHRRSSFW